MRPHIKTHKLPAIAEMQLKAGAIGITCQKISETEAMLDGSSAITDVLIAYNIIGETKLKRLRALSERVKLSVVADSLAVIGGLSASFASASLGDRPLSLQSRHDAAAASRKRLKARTGYRVDFSA